MHILSLQDLNKWFKEFNTKYFNGELKAPIFSISNTKVALGDFKPMGNLSRIRISSFFKREIRGYQQTLIHEMIHLWQWQNKLTDRKHGYDFKRKAREINRDGWDISRVTSLTYDEAKSVDPVYCDLMIWRNDRGIAVARVSDTSAALFYHQYQSSLDELKFVRAYGSYFSQFKISRKRVTYYTLTETEFKEKIKPYIIKEYSYAA